MLRELDELAIRIMRSVCPTISAARRTTRNSQREGLLVSSDQGR
jgi:hypothetical protein